MRHIKTDICLIKSTRKKQTVAVLIKIEPNWINHESSKSLIHSISRNFKIKQYNKTNIPTSKKEDLSSFNSSVIRTIRNEKLHLQTYYHNALKRDITDDSYSSRYRLLYSKCHMYQRDILQYERISSLPVLW